MIWMQMQHVRGMCSTRNRSAEFNPRRMREGYSSRYVCVCYHATCYILCLFVSNTTLQGCLPRFDCTHCVNLAENAPFTSSGIICWSPPPSSLPDELSMDKIDSNGFLSTRRLCTARDRSNKTTGSSLVVAHWQKSFLTYCANTACIRFGIARARAHTAVWHTWYCCILRNRARAMLYARMHSGGYFLHYWWGMRNLQ
jgi:hypothetical protein